MNLERWTQTLAALPAGLPVYVAHPDAIRGAHKLRSWRGAYDELTLDTHYDLAKPGATVGDLLADARAANGATFEGYKGGEYVMHGHTAVWADPWGDYLEFMITGVRQDGDRVIVDVFDGSDY